MRFLFPLLAMVGCASSNATTTSADGGVQGPGTGTTDGGTNGDAMDVQSCGAPPYVTLGIVVKAASTSGTGNPVEGAKLTIPQLCGDKSQLSAADGTITG